MLYRMGPPSGSTPTNAKEIVLSFDRHRALKLCNPPVINISKNIASKMQDSPELRPTYSSSAYQIPE